MASVSLATADPGTGSARAAGWCSFVAALGIVIAIGAVLILPRNATLFGGMLVITPLTSLFKIICLALAFFTVLSDASRKVAASSGRISGDCSSGNGRPDAARRQ